MIEIFKNLFGSNEREIKKLQPIVDKINSLYEKISRLSDEELKAKTEEFRKKIKSHQDGKNALEEILPEAFAVVREAAHRVIGEKHYDVQLIGGIILHQGKIAEMKTGEGKTLTSTLPIYLNALSGKGVHVVTVNDYLAKRDCNWMGSIFNFLGLSTACIMHETSYKYEPKLIDANAITIETENLKTITRKEAYSCDITYGTNNEFGFDFLRDNMAHSLEQYSQRGFNYVIVDEVDSILIDEARTPLIISAPDSESTKQYVKFAKIVPQLKAKEDFEVDEKMRSVTLTENGISKVEKMLGVGNIYEPGKISYVHHLEQSLKAEILFKKEKDYIVKDGKVIIVDDFTGRLMEGRRYSEGLHQAIEAKEGVAVQKESKTLATITFQNYFRMYAKISGMTGTAITSAEEFSKVYKLDVMDIPTNVPNKRKDLPDIVYKTEKGKYEAIVEEIKKITQTGQPILVGTVAIEKSEYLHVLLERDGIKHQVLNAKQHEKEAQIISNAGQKGAVTIATNMAGRGTDIKLGDGVKELGGLYIIGTERHEARRIDNQLRGRAGRQGDPGVSQFYVSLEDELMRRFGGDRMKNMMNTLGLPDDQPIQNKIISKTIENSQSKIEGFNFDIRKHVLEYDDVMNKQREVVYRKRRKILEMENMRNEIFQYVSEELEVIISSRCGIEDCSWDIETITNDISGIFPLTNEDKKQLQVISVDKGSDSATQVSKMLDYLIGKAKQAYAKKEEEIGIENMRKVERMIALQSIDTLWTNHLDQVDYLRQGIGLRGYGQRDPLIEYKKEAYNLFASLIKNIHSTIVNTIFKITLARPIEQVQAEENKKIDWKFQGADDQIEQFKTIKNQQGSASGGSLTGDPIKQKPIRAEDGPKRNDPCPCGSGKKYKRCCGA
jgi:preprotein translocase subunit SecA